MREKKSSYSGNALVDFEAIVRRQVGNSKDFEASLQPDGSVLVKNFEVSQPLTIRSGTVHNGGCDNQNNNKP